MSKLNEIWNTNLAQATSRKIPDQQCSQGYYQTKWLKETFCTNNWTLITMH